MASEGRYFQYNSDDVLGFSYKNYVLEDVMTKEDIGIEKVFYNEIISRDEIDTLLPSKPFVNTKKCYANDVH